MKDVTDSSNPYQPVKRRAKNENSVALGFSCSVPLASVLDRLWPKEYPCTNPASKSLRTSAINPADRFRKTQADMGAAPIVRVNLKLIALSLAKVVKTASLSFLAVDVPLVF